MYGDDKQDKNIKCWCFTDENGRFCYLPFFGDGQNKYFFYYEKYKLH